MTRSRHPAAAGLAAGLAAVGLLGAGCGAPSAHPAPATTVPSVPSPVATSVLTSGGTWAVAVMGGSAAVHDNFWQLFVRPTGDTTWTLATPPGVADNGGLVVVGLGGRSLAAGFRPSQGLTFSPLATTSDEGHTWSSGSLLDAGIAAVPDALAAAPGSGRMLALLTSGDVQQAASGTAAWSRLTSQRSVAASPAGLRCALAGLTAVSFTPRGAPLLAGTCGHRGVAGIFAATATATGGAAWQAAGPALPASLAGQPVEVLRLMTTPSGSAALLVAGTGSGASLIAAWTGDPSAVPAHWTVSPPLGLDAAQVLSSGFGPDGVIGVILSDGRAFAVGASAADWRTLPALPRGTATLAPEAGGEFDALAVSGSKLTVWRLASVSAAWTRTQVISVPVQYGTSG